MLLMHGSVKPREGHGMAHAHITDIPGQFGARLRALRIAARLSQETLAFQSQLDRSYVGQVERGERNVSLKNIAKLAQALNVAPYELLRFPCCCPGPEDGPEPPS
jgi:transcriptional regulator with XRE-family HTH domain